MPKPLPPRIVIVVEGGNVQSIFTDQDARIILVDWDNIKCAVDQAHETLDALQSYIEPDGVGVHVVDGYINETTPHQKLTPAVGRCPVCHHHGEDCTGLLEEPVSHRHREEQE